MRQSRGAVLPGLLASLALLLPPAASRGQAGQSVAPAPLPVVGAGKDGATATLSTLSRADGAASDIVFGRNVRGPYLLSWKGLRAGSESVVRDGVALARDADYTLDADTGVVAFALPLRPDQIARVSYRCDTPDARPNTSAQSLPLQWNMWERGQNRLTFRTLLQPSSGSEKDKTAQTPLSSLQFAGGMRIARNADLSSGLFLNLGGGDWLERSGLKLREQTRFRQGELAFSYRRAGAQFAQSDADDLKTGREIIEALGALKPLRGLSVATTLRQTTELLDTSKSGDAQSKSARGDTTREAGSVLTLALPTDGGKLEAGRTITTIAAGDGSAQTRTQDSAKIEGTVTRGTQIGVGYESLAGVSAPAKSGDAGAERTATYEQKTSVEVKHRPSEQLALTGAFGSSLSSSGAQDTTGLKVEALPFARIRKLKLTAGWEDTFRADGARRSRQALIELPPLPFGKTTLSGGVQEMSAPGVDRVTRLVNAASRPFRYLEVSGGVRLRDSALPTAAPDPDAVNTYNVKMALATSNRLRLTGKMARNPEGDDGAVRKVQAHALGLETDLGFVSLSGQYGVEDDYLKSRLLNTMELNLSLRLTHWDTLTTGFQGRSTLDQGTDATNTYLMTFTHKLGSAFDLSLSGSMTQRAANGLAAADGPDYKAEAKVGVKF